MYFADQQHQHGSRGHYGDSRETETGSHSVVSLRIIQRITRCPISTETTAYVSILFPIGSWNSRSTDCGLIQYSNPPIKRGINVSAREEKITSAARALARAASATRWLTVSPSVCKVSARLPPAFNWTASVTANIAYSGTCVRW